MIRLWIPSFLAFLLAWPRASFAEETPQSTFGNTEDYPGVRALVFSTDGKQLVSGGETGKIRFWDLGTSKELRKIDASKKPIRVLAVCGEGRLLASAGEGAESIDVWEIETGKKLRTIKLKHNVDSIAVSKDGGLVAVSGVGGLTVVSPKGGETVWVRDPDEDRTGDMLQLAASTDGSVLAYSLNDLMNDTNEVVLAEFATGKELHRFKDANVEIRSVAFSEDDRKVAAIYGEARIRVWDRKTGDLKVKMDPDKGEETDTLRVAFLGGDQVVTLGDLGTTQIWDLASGKEKRKLGADSSSCSLAVSPDRCSIAVSESDKIRIWKVAEKK